MIYLGNLAYIDTIKRIAKKHPSLLYLICIIENQQDFKLDSRIIFNLEVECRKLYNFNIINYKSSSERPLHDVSNITLRSFGKKVYNELKNHEICIKMVELLNFESKEEFLKSFYQHFSFEEDPSDEIMKEVNKIKKIFPIPDNHHKWSKDGNNLIIEYKKFNNEFIVEIKMQCRCSNLLIEQVTLESLKQNLENKFSDSDMNCNSCSKEFYIRADLYIFRYI